MIDGAADGTDSTHHRRFRFAAGSVYKLSHCLDLAGRNHLTFEGGGAETTYGHTGGAQFLSTASDHTVTTSSIFRTASGGSASADLRFHGLSATGNSTDYATSNAGNNGEVAMGFCFYGVTGFWADHCIVEKVKGDCFYLSRSGSAITTAAKITHSTLRQNGRMGVALIAVSGMTGQYIDFEDICYTAIDYEPNTSSTEGAFGTHLWENCVFGDFSWDDTFDQPLVDIAPHDAANVFSMDLTIRNCTKTGHDLNSPSKPNLTSVFRLGSSFDSTARSGVLSVTGNTDSSGGEDVGSSLYGIMDLYNWTGAITVTGNTGFKASGTNWIKDRGGNHAITQSGNT